jgi:hypothetical protein
VNRSAFIARVIAVGCRRLFMARPMPDLEVPVTATVERVA